MTGGPSGHTMQSQSLLPKTTHIASNQYPITFQPSQHDRPASATTSHLTNQHFIDPGRKSQIAIHVASPSGTSQAIFMSRNDATFLIPFYLHNIYHSYTDCLQSFSLALTLPWSNYLYQYLNFQFSARFFLLGQYTATGSSLSLFPDIPIASALLLLSTAGLGPSRPWPHSPETRHSLAVHSFQTLLWLTLGLD